MTSIRMSPRRRTTEGNLGTSDGGCVDNPFRWCDNLSNNDPNVVTFMSKAFANTLVRMAFDTSVAGASAARVNPSRAKLEQGRYGRRPARHPVTSNGRVAAQPLHGAASVRASRIDA